MSTAEQVTRNPSLQEGQGGLSPFDEIRPYEAEEMKQAFEELLADRQFNVIMKGLAPWLPKSLRNGLLRLAFTGVKTPLDFQKRFMKPVVNYIVRRYTDGLSFDDAAISEGKGQAAADENGASKAGGIVPRYTFVSNHRDIVLDSAFLDVLLVHHRYPTTVEIGIGDNLLIYPWIKRLVRMNKAFTVRRGLTPKEMLRSSQLMSRYIHYAVGTKHENIWIAQREGRAKDSDDRTQESVLKMLAMGGTASASPLASIRELNIVPLTISYEYDPCDYLKAQEFQQKRDNPQFKKSRQDDLDNMRTGIFGYKGRVSYCAATPVNTWIDELADLPRNEFFGKLSQRMDREIHLGYQLYPCNYVALDLLNQHADHADHYTPAERQHFEQYLDQRIDLVKLPNADRPFLRERLLTMYANPLRNKLAAMAQHVGLILLLLGLGGVSSCTMDSYEKGEGEYSLMRADLVEAHTGADKYVDYVLTDDGDSLRSLKPFTVKWVSTADTTYRAILYYNLVGDQAEAVSMSQTLTLPVRSHRYYQEHDGFHQDPLYLESAWLAGTRRFLNLRLRLLTGTTDDSSQRQRVGIVSDTVVTLPVATGSADSLRVGYLRLFHDQASVPEYYSSTVVASIPLTAYQPDSLVLSVATYDGTLTRCFRVR